MRIALISDIHAASAEALAQSPSYLYRRGPDEASGCPAQYLSRLVDEEKLQCEFLLCPGDIVDKAHPQAMTLGWKVLLDLKRQIGATELVATTGNHDMDSRHNHNHYDARGALQQLEQYPTRDETCLLKYWTYHFAIHDFARGYGMRLLNINTSAFHDASPPTDTHARTTDSNWEYEHGRISPYTLDRIRRELERSDAPDYAINIALLHHHPVIHSESGLGDSDQIQGGKELIDLLSDSQFGRWLIIHGHKHHPKISHSPGKQTAPMIFSAGSFSCKLYPQLSTTCRNQFYVLDFDVSCPNRPSGFGGRFKAWEWSVELGWRPATPTSGLPHEGGFGWRGDPVELARGIANDLPPGQNVTIDELKKKFPQLSYIMPGDLLEVKQLLLRTHGIRWLFDEYGKPGDITRGSGR